MLGYVVRLSSKELCPLTVKVYVILLRIAAAGVGLRRQTMIPRTHLVGVECKQGYSEHESLVFCFWPSSAAKITVNKN